MEHRSRTSLDNPVFRGRVRTPRDTVLHVRQNPSVKFYDIRPTPRVAKKLPASPLVAVPVPQVELRNINTIQKPQLPVMDKPLKHLPKQTRSSVLRRETVKNVLPKTPNKRRKQLVPTLLSGMAIVLFIVGVLVAFSTLRTNSTVKAQVKQLSNNSGDGAPSEDEPPTNLGSYTVAPDLPRILTINKINVSARVRRLGVTEDNALKAPGNIFDVGWYDSSAKPGENGTVVLDGHVSGPTKHGVFYDIKLLKSGDKISLERGDGKVFNYTVTGSQVYDHDKVDMAKLLTTSVPGKPGLNLITCTGHLNTRTSSFDQRVVVFSVQD